MTNFFQSIGLPELIFVLVIILLFFGGKKMKELAGGLGSSAKELKKIKKDLSDTPDKGSSKGGV